MAGRSLTQADITSGSNVEALVRQGNALYQQGRYAEAVRVYSMARRLAPQHTPTLNNLASALGKIGAREDALTLLQQLLRERPDDPGLLNNYGNALSALGRHDEAIDCFNQALKARPDDAMTFYNRGTSQRLVNRLPEAIADFCRALALQPGYPGAEWNLSLAWLAQGDFAHGWPAYESRWRKREARALPDWGLPRWRGEPLALTQTLLLQGEQGFGDTLQFIRYVHSLQTRGISCMVQVRSGLESLLARSFPDLRVVPERQPDPAWGTAYRCPLLSLPEVMGTLKEQDIPTQTPYLSPDAGHVARWREVLSRLPPGSLRLGLVWRGSPTHLNDARRSLAIQDLWPLFALHGVQWVILQKDLSPVERQWLHAWPEVMIASDQLRTWDDTAALVTQLDLIVSVDTSVAHLAGALARPTWVLLPHCPDWRWQLERRDCPWYPSMRLYRQSSPGQWGAVLEQVSSDIYTKVTQK